MPKNHVILYINILVRIFEIYNDRFYRNILYLKCNRKIVIITWFKISFYNDYTRLYYIYYVFLLFYILSRWKINLGSTIVMILFFILWHRLVSKFCIYMRKFYTHLTQNNFRAIQGYSTVDFTVTMYVKAKDVNLKYVSWIRYKVIHILIFQPLYTWFLFIVTHKWIYLLKNIKNMSFLHIYKSINHINCVHLNEIYLLR